MQADLNLGDTRLIIETARARNVLRNQLAYILATGYWETARTMKPVVEAYWLSEAWRKANLRYYPWHGRGYVQLTWEDNYRKAGEKLGLDLTTDPDVVKQPEIAAPILVVGSMEGWFTGKSIPDYITLEKSNFASARRVINGTDKAAEIADIARVYDAALKAEGYGDAPEADVLTPDPTDDDTGALRALVSQFITDAQALL
ncbi:glycoside hydrolase family 19 protein [Salipiger sp. 1_MG-2023]|uniref:glycoside hydrolase family 19 protein n=1 Tax=Salipiger sp. 1_MG-2023 TaxID=3062665 RepID=UPI0026E41249|nr:glycoside hydrolase family 19 protein [Salipiger sp. 1_MG-2023]MDO6587318.1 glycoside hydrolase family 19 protein [Salipiger sp. 1_MG-2023]